MSDVISTDSLSVVQVFIANQSILRDAISASCPTLTPNEINSVLGDLSARVRRYRPRQFNERAAFRFMRWWAVRQGRRTEFLNIGFWSYRAKLTKAADSMLRRCKAKDFSASGEDIVSDLLLYLWRHPQVIDTLLCPGDKPLEKRLGTLLRNRLSGCHIKKIVHRCRLTSEFSATVAKRLPETATSVEDRIRVGMDSALTEKQKKLASA